MRFFEDIDLEAVQESGLSAPISAGQIKRFAAEFDPMPFHLDEEAAKASPMGGLCASSVHVLALATKLSHELRSAGGAAELAVLGGLGWDDIRFEAPLLAGDRVRVRTSIAGARTSRSRPGMGIVTTRVEMLREDGARIAGMCVATLVARRK